jgi:DNA-binding transcriptional ArsR family regulator
MGCPFKAIADNTRREILVYLSKGDTFAGEIAGKFNISKPAISNHLKILKEADLVNEKKVKQNRIYSLNKNQVNKVKTYLEGLV